MSGVVIVGSGLAGYMTAKAWRELDAKTPLTLVTQEAGGFYSKPQLSTAMAHGKTADDLMLYTASEMEQQLQARILTRACVSAINPRQKTLSLESGEYLAYDQLVLALGANVIRPPLGGDAASAVLSVNHWQDYAMLREKLVKVQRIVILGAGLVGCEFANDWIQQGYNVTMIAPDETPMQRYLPAELGFCVQKVFEAHGVQWHLGQFATDIHALKPEGYRLTLCRHLGEVDADLVVSAVGFRPNEHLARAAGLHCDQGIRVGADFRTSDPAIFAIGDCAVIDGFWRPFVAPIVQGSKILAQNLTGKSLEIHYPPLPIVAKTTLCPVSICPPPEGTEGAWVVEGEGPNRVARFLNAEGQLKGFALSGSATSKRQALLADLV